MIDKELRDKKKLISDFETCYWELDPVVKQQMLLLPFDSFVLKIIEWQNWAEIGGRIEF